MTDTDIREELFHFSSHPNYYYPPPLIPPHHPIFSPRALKGKRRDKRGERVIYL
jgi:hypothetical protein